MARLGPPGTSAFPPLVGAKRTSIGECKRSRLMSTRRSEAWSAEPRPGSGAPHQSHLDGAPDGRVSIGRLDLADVESALDPFGMSLDDLFYGTSFSAFPGAVFKSLPRVRPVVTLIILITSPCL